MLAQPLRDANIEPRDVVNLWREDSPALKTSRLSSFALKEDHVLLLSQSSRPQQHKATSSGSGDLTREKSARARVRSSMVAVASRKLLCESGVEGRESMSTDMVTVVVA